MSQLHERLEHLVQYSSQLIFVSGDSAAIQQRTLSNFLASQGDSTEVSFFAATDIQDSSDYRRIICRQLANHTVGSFVRPLSELLRDLDPNKGPYLVCISNAQLIDMSFLNEIWEWVTSSRAHNDMLHVNVILFGSSEWTEDAQKWLPEHHTNKPVLLSSQSIDPVGFDVSALENLMAQKRAFFANENRYTIVRKKWFIAAVLGLFFLIFAALISVQYPQQVKALLFEGELSTAPAETTRNEDVADAANESQAIIDAAEQNLATEQEQSAGYQSPLEVVSTSQTDKMFASDWVQNEPSVKALEPTPQATEGETTQDISDEPVEQITENEQADAQDFAVEDITSIQDLDQRLEQSLAQEPPAPTQQQPTANSQRQFAFDEAVLLNMPASDVTIQLSGIQNRSILDEYIRDNGLADQVWVYQTQRYGGPWYVVLYAQRYSTIAQASDAIASLPDNIRSSGPFAKSLRQIQTEIQQQ